MKLVFSLKKNLSQKQKEFILTSLNNSFPKHTFFFSKNLKNSSDVYFVPAFTGLGAPYWNSDVRGQISGITRDTSKADIALAALKSICFQTRDLFECFKTDTSRPIADFVVRVDGGMSKNNLMMSSYVRCFYIILKTKNLYHF